jgi:hypothetical protein
MFPVNGSSNLPEYTNSISTIRSARLLDILEFHLSWGTTPLLQDLSALSLRMSTAQAHTAKNKKRQGPHCSHDLSAAVSGVAPGKKHWFFICYKSILL